MEKKKNNIKNNSSKVHWNIMKHFKTQMAMQLIFGFIKLIFNTFARNESDDNSINKFQGFCTKKGL